MDKLWIVLYSHHHGVDPTPVVQAARPKDNQMRKIANKIADDGAGRKFDPEIGETAHAEGPYDLGELGLKTTSNRSR